MSMGKGWELVRLSDGKYSVRADGEEVGIVGPFRPYVSRVPEDGPKILEDRDYFERRISREFEHLLNSIPAVTCLE